MPSSEEKGSIEDLKDRIRSLFDPRDPQKKKDALPLRAEQKEAKDKSKKAV